MISPTACGALSSARTTPQPSQNLVEPSWNLTFVEPSWNLGGTFVEPSWNLTSGPPRITPEPIWAETPKHSAVGEKQTKEQRTGYIYIYMYVVGLSSVENQSQAQLPEQQISQIYSWDVSQNNQQIPTPGPLLTPPEMAVAQKYVPKMGCPGKWKHGLSISWRFNFDPHPGESHHPPPLTFI